VTNLNGQNHDFDFGVPQFRTLTSQCNFPWLLANVLDPALGKDIPIGNAGRTKLLTSSNNIKVGCIGLGEREWLATINSLPPNLDYRSASGTADQLTPQLRTDGAEIVIAITHQREPNDVKLAEKAATGSIDLILGGHDHYYNLQVINSVPVLRSGTDFKQLSYIEAWRKSDGKGFDFRITRRDIVSSIAEDLETVKIVQKLTEKLKTRLEHPIGATLVPLDARFTTVRLRESNIGNLVCDVMKHYYDGDCCIMAGGTIRGDQVYPPGVIKLKDIMNCFPFEDPVVVIGANGKAIREALENSVCLYPALEGRFPQVSGIQFKFNPKRPAGKRILSVNVNDSPIDPEKNYRLVTRGYMARGKDGYDSLLIEPEGGTAQELVSEENGVLISTILRQFFMALRVVGRWHNWGRSMERHWGGVLNEMNSQDNTSFIKARPRTRTTAVVDQAKTDELVGSEDSEIDLEGNKEARNQPGSRNENEVVLVKKVLKKWRRLAGVRVEGDTIDSMDVEDFDVSWTNAVAPQLEGRIQLVDD
jgi:5'-nucleotidase